jgi:hypothetical protein
LDSRDAVFLVIGAAVVATVMLAVGWLSAVSISLDGAEGMPVPENKQNDPTHPGAGSTGDSAFGPDFLINSQVEENDDDPANSSLFFLIPLCFLIPLWVPRLLVVNEKLMKLKGVCGRALARPG